MRRISRRTYRPHTVTKCITLIIAVTIFLHFIILLFVGSGDVGVTEQLHELSSFTSPVQNEYIPNHSETRLMEDEASDSVWYQTDGYGLDHLMGMIGDHPHFWFIKNRIRELWPEYEAAARLVRNGSECHEWKGQQLKIMVLPGVLSLTNFAKPDVISRGGPLGELIQWSDLIGTCYVLCHTLFLRLHVESTAYELREQFKQLNGYTDGCRDVNFVDIIFIDLIGLQTLPRDVQETFRNKFRVLDAFGTEAIYNDAEYVELHPSLAYDAGWGKHNVHLKQFYSLYPHTPDNSFLGFIVPSNKLNNVTEKDNFALIMGKEVRYLEGKKQMLETVMKYMPLRATMRQFSNPWIVPNGMHFYGVVDRQTYQQIISSAKVCIGLGDPIESPSVLEALARGCIFLNPRLKGDRSTFHGKPTSRKITSQVPYFEDFISPPHSYTLDYDDLSELTGALDNITKSDSLISPFIPYEFTSQGFVERLDAYLTHHNYCDEHRPLWPPLSALQVLPSPSGLSCARTCHVHGLVCEPEYFHVLNNESFLAGFRLKTKAVSCDSVVYEAEPYLPAIMHVESDSKSAMIRCELQARKQLFSCAGDHPRNATRICPCRSFKERQIALCNEC